ncbi:MAG: ABC transporter ATP-binding protein [Acidimicrobiales bacterium]
MMTFGGGGPSSQQANAAAGLPHAGVPGSLAQKVDEVLKAEPVHDAPVIEFSRSQFDRRPFGLRTFLAPQRVALMGAFVLVVIETIALQAGPFLTQFAIDDGIVKDDYSVVVMATIFYFASIVISSLATHQRIRFTGRLGERLMYALRIRVFTHLSRQSMAFYTDEKAGVLMTRMTSDVEALSVLFQEGLVNFAVQVLTLVVIAVALFLFNVKLAVITFVAVIPPMIVLSLWFRKVSDDGYTKVRNRIADVLSDLSESLAGIRIITAYNRRRHNVIHHVNVVGRHLDANLDTARANGVYAPGSEAIGVLGQALILLVGGHMVLNGELTVGRLAAFLLYLTAFFAPIQQLVQLYNTYQQGNAAVVKLRELFLTEPEVVEAVDAQVLPPIAGEIVLDHVTFGYTDDRPILHDVSLTIAAGESMAVVGSTGAGKSTIAKLVVRFYDPQGGRVLIDGHDLRDVTLDSLRRQLGVVPQEPFLFHGTFRNNVAFANPDATDDEILEACRAVGLDDVIERLPDGLDSAVHERGASLSAGERQLLALARAFLARPRVLVLDEATSNLDLTSEAKIERALDTLLEGRTAIIIAHRLATAMRCDRIAVVEDGHVVELGSHQELVARNGRYAALYATWLAHMTGAATNGSH